MRVQEQYNTFSIYSQLKSYSASQEVPLSRKPTITSDIMFEQGKTARPLIFGSLVAISAMPLVMAHTNLAYPEPYNPVDCNLPDCTGPVPHVWHSGPAKARNSKEHPAAVWQRGQKVTIKWHRNNHGGGFYRMSLVPVAKQHDWWWHKYAGFQYGCFESGQYHCNGPVECGTDADGLAYKQDVTIPAVFPDGQYVFTMVWFGGLKWNRKQAKYSDYFSASHVTIRGGKPVEDWYKPKFEPMESPFSNAHGDKRVPKGKCASTSSWVGECGGTPCHHNKPMMTIPGVFRDGFQPDWIDSDEVRKCVHRG